MVTEKGKSAVKEHRHCVVCGKMTPNAEKFVCSPDCENLLNQHQKLLKRRKSMSTMFFIFFLVAVVVLIIVSQVMRSGASS